METGWKVERRVTDLIDGNGEICDREIYWCVVRSRWNVEDQEMVDDMVFTGSLADCAAFLELDSRMLLEWDGDMIV